MISDFVFGLAYGKFGHSIGLCVIHLGLPPGNQAMLTREAWLGDVILTDFI